MTEATCGSCDYLGDGFIRRCDEPAPYRADYEFLGGDGDDYTIAVCPRHAAAARTHGSLQRLYTAGAR